MSSPIATVKRTKDIQERYSVFTKKNFGQNFIIEPRIVEKIAEAAVQSPDDLVLEVGPGIGALTEQLVKRSDHVVAYEIDPRLPEVLENEIGSDHLQVILKDFLEVDISAEIRRLKKPGQKVRFASNLPYYITTPILFRLFEAEEPLDSITVMMQKEVADRFMAPENSKDYNALSVITQYRAQVEKVMDVSRHVFWPKPRVDSAVIRFTFPEGRKKVPDEPLFFAFVKGCFLQRRKTLYNNIGAFLDDKELARKILEKSAIPENTRAQQLSVADFIRLYEENYESIRERKSESGA